MLAPRTRRRCDLDFDEGPSDTARRVLPAVASDSSANTPARLDSRSPAPCLGYSEDASRRLWTLEGASRPLSRLHSHRVVGGDDMGEEGVPTSARERGSSFPNPGDHRVWRALLRRATEV